MGLVHHPNVVTDGLKGCWDAGNRRSYPGTGTTWTDLAGGIQGTLMNEDDDALNFNSFKGGYFELDGTDGRVDCGDNLICTWSEVSICLWASATDISSGSMGMVSRGHGVVFEFSMSMDTAQKCLSCLVDGGWLLSDAGSLNSYFGKWTHYAMRWITGTDNFRLYINGEVVKTGTQSIVNIGSSGKQNLCIGDRGLVNNKEFNGDIGPVYIYDRALSDDEIKQNYEATKSRFEPRITKSGLVGNWDAGDPDCYVGGLTCKDTASGTASTLENNGTNLNFNSANGGYWEFDGTDDYIQCSTNSVLQPQSLSLVAWVKDDNVLRRPIAGWNAGSVTPSVWSQYKGSLRGPLLYMNSSDWRYFSTFDSVDEWHHFVFTYTYEDTTTGVLYIDGASIGVQSTADNNSKASTDTFRIGRANTYYYEGSIALVRMYDTPLSAAEILDNYNKTKGRFGH